MSPRRASELASLRSLADELSKRKNERTTTTHLLAAIAQAEGVASGLLAERRLKAEVLLSATRATVDDAPDAVEKALARAQDIAARSPSRTAGGLHLLYALCQERSSAAHRVIVQCGVDVSRLRASTMQLLMGLVEPRRVPPTPTAKPIAARARLTTSLPFGSSGPSASSASATSGLSPASPSTHRTRPLPPPKPASTPKPLPKPAGRPLPARPLSHATSSRPVRRVSETPAVSRFELDPKRFPTLLQVGKNLTLAAERGELDPVVERDAEIERTLDVLAKRQGNNPCLIGAAGVGKTSIVRGLAARIAEGRTVSTLDDRVVVEVDASLLIAGTGVRGALAERITALKSEVARSEGKIVVFFDEVHRLFGPEAGDEGASELRRALAKGELPCIGATTTEDFRKHIESDATLARRFTAVEVVELSPDASIEAITRIAPTFERHHQARYDAPAIDAAVRWSARYLPDRALPDKAVSILDLAGARARRRGSLAVEAAQVADVVSELTGVPRERLLESDGERMLRLEETMALRIVGHGHAIAKVAAVLRRNASGFRARRPIGTFLLLGSTGVGKTETAKAIAECLFHSPLAMTRLDLSEFAEPHAIARLVGAPPGYVGHEAGGQLTEAVRRRPYQVILLDEIEKAHRDVLEAFLQVFDEGRMTDGRGRTVDFTNTVIVLTSNLGASIAVPQNAKGRIGFAAAKNDDDRKSKAYEDAVLAAAREGLPPELYNRFDEVLAFAPLTRADVAAIAHRMLAALGAELETARGVRLLVEESVIDALLDAGGFDPSLGARPMRRAIGRFVETPLAELLLRGTARKGSILRLHADAGTIELAAHLAAGVA